MIQHVRQLAEKFSHTEIEACIDEHIKEQSNACFVGADDTETMNVLSKASWVKHEIETGAVENLTDAMRKLAASMRAIQQTG
ncbi:hypothetical protein HQ585_20585 [candidate division KSB1 bacterium]|nr:hypothetical protein [candidate division KSB1 bacterium]